MAAYSAGPDPDEPPVTPAPGSGTYATRDPVADLVVNHWFGDAEIDSLRRTAFYPQRLMQDRYDPSAGSEFYRGYIVALVAMAQAVGPADSLQFYQGVVNRIDEVMRSWAGTPDQAGGARFALMNAYQYSESGEPVAQIVPFVRGEIACIAECFHLARQHGL